jgi:ABC-type multidrug transport system permease subunit
LSPIVAFTITISSIIIMLVLNFWFKVKFFNYFLILLTSIGCVVFLLIYALPNILNRLLIFSGCILEIYFISPYLTLRISGVRILLNYFISLVLTVSVALLLSYLATKLQKLILSYNYKCKVAPKLGLEETHR